MECGYLCEVSTDRGTVFRGQLVMPFYGGPLYVVPRLPKPKDSSPDWTVKALLPGRSGRAPADWYELGRAWDKTVRSGENKGARFLSLQLDAAGVTTEPVSLAAFPSRQPGEEVTDPETGEVKAAPRLDLVWGRYDPTKRGTRSDAAQGGGDATIPF